jgi:hypothetical protein
VSRLLKEGTYGLVPIGIALELLRSLRHSSWKCLDYLAATLIVGDYALASEDCVSYGPKAPFHRRPMAFVVATDHKVRDGVSSGDRHLIGADNIGPGRSRPGIILAARAKPA